MKKELVWTLLFLGAAVLTVVVLASNAPLGSTQRQYLQGSSGWKALKLPEAQWEVVKDLLYVQGSWESSTTQAVLTSRLRTVADGGLWTAPYPFLLKVYQEKKEAYDCGYFGPIEDPSGWRVAYCLGGGLEKAGGRHALRLVLELSRPQPKEESLRIAIGSREEVVVSRRISPP